MKTNKTNRTNQVSPKITVKAYCTACKGTGLYIGFAEVDGAAVQCNVCRGTGEVTVEYDPFKGRKRRDDIKRVYPATGHKISAEDITTREGQFLPFSQWGITYQEWLDGVEIKPIRELNCPMIGTGQSSEARAICLQRDNVQFWGTRIPSCPLYPGVGCWELYDVECQKKKKRS